MTAITKQADNRMAKKNGEAMPATAAATNAKDNMALPRSGTNGKISSSLRGSCFAILRGTPQGREQTFSSMLLVPLDS